MIRDARNNLTGSVRPQLLPPILFLLFSGMTQSYSAPISLYSPAGLTISVGQSPDIVLVATKLAMLEDGIKKGLEKSADPSIRIQKANSQFLDYAPNNKNFHLTLAVEGSAEKGGISTNFSCAVDTRFSIPASRVSDVRIIKSSLDVSCEISNDILRPILLPSLVQAVSTEIDKDLDRSLIPHEEIERLTKQNPDLAKLLQKGWIQGEYCGDFQGDPSFCLRVAWISNSLLSYIDAYVGSAPSKTTPASLAGMSELRDRLRATAPRKPSARYPGYNFPVGQSEAGWTQGDMALFGGLLCASGEAEGCTLVERSQGQDGQFWRSPDQVGESPPPGEEGSYSVFSGDQFNGVVAYFLSDDNADAFKRYLKFIASNRFYFPEAIRPVDYGYKSCKIDANNTCLLQGQEWNWLKALASRFGADSLIPSDSREVRRRYGYDRDFLEWQAAFAPLGKDAYQLHLVAIQIYLARKAGVSDPALDRAASILAARQSHNPFYLYLHLGKDSLVQAELMQKCVPDPQRQTRSEWAWQRDEGEQKWKESMQWDCIFMLNNLLN